MNKILQLGNGSIERQLTLREAIDAFREHEKLSNRIKQLLSESNDARDRGQWKKAHDLLWELQKVTQNNN